MLRSRLPASSARNALVPPPSRDGKVLLKDETGREILPCNPTDNPAHNRCHMLQHRTYHLLDTVFRPLPFPGVMETAPFLNSPSVIWAGEEGEFIHSVELDYLHLAKGIFTSCSLLR